jgi:FkbM family methyltransferase
MSEQSETVRQLSGWQAFIVRCTQALPANSFGRKVALVLRKAVLCFGSERVDAMVEGLKMRLHLRDNICERKLLFMPQFFDTAERHYMQTHLKKGDVFFDVGANIGIYALTAAQCVSETGRVIAVEPNPVVLDRLMFNVVQNGFENRVTALQQGVSDTSGVFTLTLDPTNLGGSSLILDRSGQGIEIPCQPLLDIARDQGIEKISGMKIDIEGAEDKVLIPFFEIAPKELYPGFLILENSQGDWENDLEAHLKQVGYTPVIQTRMNTVWQRIGRPS